MSACENSRNANSPDGSGFISQPGIWWAAEFPPAVKSRLLKYYSEEELLAIGKALATPPNCTSVRVNTIKISREAFVVQLREKLKALAEQNGQDVEEAFGTIEEHKILPDAVLIRPHNKSRQEVVAEGRELLVSRKCAEAVLKGANIFCPGMVGCSPRAAKGDKVTILCDVYDRHLRGAATHILSTGKLDPKRLKGKLSHTLDPSSDEMARYFRTGSDRLDHKYGEAENASKLATGAERLERLPPGIVIIGKGIMEVDRRVAMSAKEGLGCRVTHCVYRAPPLNSILDGLMYVQNLPSMCVPHALSPKPGERILDMCSSPGGKATHTAALMNGEGKVIALDRTTVKVKIVRKWAENLNLPNVEVLKADCTMLLKEEPCDEGTTNTDESAAPQPHFDEESFDHILLDPPCTALGLRPRLFIDVPQVLMETMPYYQRRMLQVASRLLKRGGRLTYSTCTINPAENEENVAYALANLPLRLIPAEPIVGGPGRANCGLSEEDRKKVQRFEPSQVDTNGFFLALFVKQ